MIANNNQEGEARVWWQFAVGFTREAAVIAGTYSPFSFGLAHDVASGRLFQTSHELLGTIVTAYDPAATVEALTSQSLSDRLRPRRGLGARPKG